MNVPGSQIPLRRYRRRILGWGAVGVIGIFAGGAAIFVARVEDDLEQRVVKEFNDAQVGPVTAIFSGQDGTLLCSEGAVDIPDDLVERSRDLWGVASLDLDESCMQVAVSVDDDSAVPSTEPLATAESEATSPPADADTVASLVASGSQFSTLEGLLSDVGLDATLAGDGPFTLFAPTNEAFQALGPDAIAALGRDTELLTIVLSHHVTAGAVASADLSGGTVEMLDGSSITVEVDNGVTLISGASTATVTEADLIADNGVIHAIDHVLIPVGVTIGANTAEPTLAAEVADGQIFLRGTVATDTQRTQLIAAAGVRINPANVVDELVVGPGSAVTDADVEGFANLASLMVPNLISGEATLTGSGVTLVGVYATDEQSTTLNSVSSDDVTFDLTERVAATEADAVTLEADLNALVAANPILFDSGSTTITAESAAIIDRVAALSNRVGGIAIEIQGHTDTDGLAATNQQLSEGRAAAVGTALVDRGIAADSLTTAGFGGSQPIVDAAGVEDKAASRRVEFVVSVQ
jgi:outer membrane protein OmpA-like peptidoglycan-associated protein/uncharacterized surface protein with fasciclin (FAS1) repeats